LLIFVIGFTSNAYGQVVEPIVVTTDKESYYEGETIVVSGEVSEILFGYAVSIIMIAPNGETVSMAQAKVSSEKTFSTELTAGGALMKADGEYTIKVLYATENRTDETTFLYNVPADFHEIPIIGDNSCKIKTNKALELLKNKAKNHFEIVTDHIRIIKCVEKGSGIRVQDSRVLVGEMTINAGTVWYAGSLVHESCHSLLYSDYLKNNPQSNYVPSDIYSGRDAEAFCLGLQYYALSLIDHGRYTSDYFVNILKSEYWEIPYEDRWW